MSLPSLKLLGGFELVVDGGARPLPAKARALLAYLAVVPGTFHLRDKLAALLWGDASDAQARDSLRHVTTQLRQALNGRGRDVLVSRGQAFALDPTSIEVDVSEFDRLTTASEPDSWQAATARYRGDLLDGLIVSAPAFEEWLRAERQRLHESAIELLSRLLAHHMDRGSLDAAVQNATRLLALDPLQEPVHRALMRVYARQGRRGAALRQYQTCVDVLRRELGIEPEAQTKRAYGDILAAQEPVAAAPVAAGRVRVPDASRPPLVGRGADLGHLLAAQQRAVDGHGEAVLILGEAGVGKSRLVAELGDAVSAGDALVLSGQAYETEQLLPYGVWSQALRSSGLLAGPRALGGLAPQWRAELARLFPELGADAVARPATPDAHARLFEAIVKLIEHAAARQPLLIVLEDLHWADPMSVQLLSFVGRRIDRLRVLIVGTAREEELADLTGFPATTLALAPLSYDDIVALVATVGPRRGSVDDAAEPVWTISEGNPFVAVEMIGMLEDGDSAAIGERAGVPGRVRDLIRRRVDRLSPHARRLVEAAAVIGRDFDFQLLRDAAGLDDRDAADGVEELVRRRLVRLAGEGFAFTHDRVRRAVYDDLLPPRRALLHHAVAIAIERLDVGRAEGIDERLGYHYSNSDHAERAIVHLRRSAARAGSRFALAEAIASLERAQALTTQLPVADRARVLLEVLIEKADFLVYQGRFSDVADVFDRHADLVERVGDDALTGRFFFYRALATSLMGQGPRAAAQADRSRAAARRAGDRSTEGRALAVLALVAFWSGHPESGIASARHAVARLADAADDEWLSVAYFYLAVNATQRGDLAAADEANALAVAVAERAGSARLRTFAAWSSGWALTMAGDTTAGVRACADAVRLAPDPLGAANANGFLGYARLAAGDVDGARDALQLAVDSSARFGFRPQEGWFGAWLAEALLAAGQTMAARDRAEQAIAIGRQVQFPFGVGVALRAAGRIALAAGDAPAAAARLQEAIETFDAIPARVEAARTRAVLSAIAV